MQNVNIGAHCRIRFSRFLSLNNKYHGRTLLCRADYQGRPIPGRISFSADAVTVKLVGFEHFVHFEHGDTVLLQLEDNCYCTAIADPTSPGINQTATDLCHSVKFDVSQAIIGFRPWKEADRVQEFYFRLSDVNGVLEAPDIRRMITATKVSEHSNSKIIEACSGDATITISYRLSFGWPDDFYKVDDFHGCIRFTSAKTVEEISEYVALIRTFFTMAAGVTVSTKDYWLVPDSNHEQPMLGGGVALAPFQLLWSGGEHHLSRVPKTSKPTSVLRSWTIEDREAVSKCLAFWMDNWNKWKPAFQALFLATYAGNTFDTDRVINACKWLETTPGTEAQKLGIEGELKKITEVAQSKAKELGLNLDRRIAFAIEKLNSESRRDVVKRLIDIGVAVGDEKLKKRFRSDVNKALDFRNRFAHDTFDHENNEDFGNYVRCTMAVEALAFLLLYKSLPLPADHHWGHGPNNFTEYLFL